VESINQPGAGVAAQSSEDSRLLRELVDHLRQRRPELQQEWAARITDAQDRLLAHATTTCLVFDLPKGA